MKYKTYDDYVKHQTSKILLPGVKTRLLTTEWKVWLDGFKKIFYPHKQILSNCNRALCLGARTGQEVQALKDMKVDAIGIDLMPFPPLVIQGDVHAIPYEENSFDFVFSNIFDHVLCPEKFVSEINRVLKKNGYALLLFYIGDLDEYGVTPVGNVNRDVLPLLKDFKLVQSRQIKLTGVLSCYTWEVLIQK